MRCKMRRRMTLLKSMVITTILIVGCTSEVKELPSPSLEEEVEEVEESPDLVIGYHEYPSTIVQTYLAKTMLEEKGYHISMEQITRENMLEALEEGQIDVTFGCWLPDLDQGLIANNDSIKDIGINYASSSAELFVPSYAHIASTEELNFYKKQLGQKIYVLEKNSVLDAQLTQWLDEKNYSYELINVSTEDLDHMIQKAMETEEWFVFAGWAPHYLLGKYELRALNGEEALVGYPQQMHTLIRTDYDQEDIKTLLSGLYVENWEMNDLMYQLKRTEAKNYADVINQWSKHNYFTLNKTK